MSNIQKAESKEPTAMNHFRQQLEQRLETFTEALPAHITPVQFKSVIMQAVMGNPDLLAADRVSLFEAALAAANDGLLPDKREGAMVIYNTKIKGKEGQRDQWIKKVQWMPMIRGVITKVFNTGQVKSVSIGIVYGGDTFRFWTDDEGDHLFHEPAENPDKSVWRRVYALVVMNNGGVFAEVMDSEEVEKLRTASKTPDTGPWVTWYDEMAKKGVFRRLNKRLPISRDIQQVLDRDNHLYDFNNQDRLPSRETGKSITSRLDDIAGPRQLTHEPAETVPVETQVEGTKVRGSTKADNQAREIAGRKSHQADVKHNADGEILDEDDQQDVDERDPITIAADFGRENRSKGMSRKAIPAEYRKDEELTKAYLEGFDGGDE